MTSHFKMTKNPNKISKGLNKTGIYFEMTKKKISTILLVFFKPFLRLLGLHATNRQSHCSACICVRKCYGKALVSQHSTLKKYRSTYN